MALFALGVWLFPEKNNTQLPIETTADLPLTSTENLIKHLSTLAASPTMTLTAVASQTESATVTPVPRVFNWTGNEVLLPNSSINAANVTQLSLLARAQIGDGGATDLKWSPDGNRLAYGLGNFAYVRKVQDGKIVFKSEDLLRKVFCLAISPTGEFLAAGTPDLLYIWSIDDGSRILELANECYRSVAFVPDGRTIVADGPTGANLWEVSSASLLHPFSNYEGINGFSISANGDLVAVATHENTILISRISDGLLVKILDGEKYDFRTVAFSPTGSLLAAKDKGGQIWVWRVSDWRLVGSMLENSGRGHEQLVFSKSGDILISSTSSWRVATIRIWKHQDAELLREINLVESVWGLSISPDGVILAVGTENDTFLNHQQGHHEPTFINLFGIKP